MKAICRHGYIMKLPCNWVKDGCCGEDCKECVILRLMGDKNE